MLPLLLIVILASFVAVFALFEYLKRKEDKKHIHESHHDEDNGKCAAWPREEREKMNGNGDSSKRAQRPNSARRAK